MAYAVGSPLISEVKPGRWSYRWMRDHLGIAPVVSRAWIGTHVRRSYS